MGHVDHGKTSLLDYIRKARVAAGEAGGITQHIAAYKVPVKVGKDKRNVVFLDTPGHAAFSAMRARGAQVTDVVILIVAADDGPMPQTVEAINHARAAGVPIVVAINKCDRPEANPEKVRQQLTEHGIVPEEWGGDTQVLNISAKSGEGVQELLEAIVLQADLLELRAVTDRPAKGIVLEAELSRGRGPVATVLVQEGTLHRGDIFVAGKASGRVRALIDDKGRQVKSAGPATPVEVLGLGAVPPPSEPFFVVKEEKDARAIVSHIEDKEREKRLADERKRVSLDDLFDQMQAGQLKTLALIIKSDVQGSLEALRQAFSALKHPELDVRIIHSAVGAISESDVTLASASNAIIIGFNVRPEKNAKALAEQEGIDVKLYSVIYTAVDDVKAAMEGLLSPLIKESFVGKAAVRDTFTIPKQGTIAGCAVLQGKLVRGAKARLVRDGIVVTTTAIDSLRRFKDSVEEVDRGHECGVHLDRYNDVKVGDEIECFELIEVKQTLD
jgi:translation initiation factor IF-2